MGPQGFVRQTGNDFLIGEEFAGPFQELIEGQLDVHHG
jgi:hypothetical protein